MELITLPFYLAFGLISVNVASVLAAANSSSLIPGILSVTTQPSTSSPTTTTSSTTPTTTITTTTTTTPTSPTTRKTTSTTTEIPATSTTVGTQLTTSSIPNATAVCSGIDGDRKTIAIVSGCLSVIIIILLIIIVVLLFKLKRNLSPCFAKNSSSTSKPNELNTLETPRGQGGRRLQTQNQEGTSREQDVVPALHYSRMDAEHELADYVNGENTYAEFHDQPVNGNATTKKDQLEAARSDRDTVYMNMSVGQGDNLYQNKPASFQSFKLSLGNIYSN
ncbi:hypothetical protein BsWGS_25357 [Bradybaena similaris]